VALYLREPAPSTSVCQARCILCPCCKAFCWCAYWRDVQGQSPPGARHHCLRLSQEMWQGLRVRNPGLYMRWVREVLHLLHVCNSLYSPACSRLNSTRSARPMSTQELSHFPQAQLTPWPKSFRHFPRKHSLDQTDPETPPQSPHLSPQQFPQHLYQACTGNHSHKQSSAHQHTSAVHKSGQGR
jgi:hypothetical protein